MKKDVEEIKNEFKNFQQYYLPKIYAFTLPVNDFQNSLKIGDTYRAIFLRLNEWRKDYPNLIPIIDTNNNLAMVDDNVFFRDHAVHSYLLREKQKSKVSKQVFYKLGIHYSKEFFADVTAQDINDALNDIVRSYGDPSAPYEYYRLSTRGHERVSLGNNAEQWKIRDNQQQVINNFIKAIKEGRTNLLMYAVMRFGKSFTALCCAKEMKARFVVVVTGKAEVETEWQANVQKPDIFKNFIFKTNHDLIENPRLINDFITNKNDNKTIVLFLTLQNISQLDKHTNKIKARLEQVFGNAIDLLIVDETHFAARSKVYGKPLNQDKISSTEEKFAFDDDSSGYDIYEANEIINKSNYLHAKIKLHLSGTPYKILSETEFDDIDIISKVQYSDIIDAKEKWDTENSLKEESERREEWENPYYGFPTMLRFAFNLSNKAKEKLATLNGKYTHQLTELFMPLSIKKDETSNRHKLFKYENEVLNMLKAIDGVEEDQNILPFLDFKPINDARLCKHIVFVLPRVASCDAMDSLLNKYQSIFKNLKDYKVLNVSGFNGKDNYGDSNALIRALKQAEDSNKKTITLTVNRFLTGSTITYWDTMIFLKGTHSAQEYDQSIFRLQSAYVSEYVSKVGKTEKTIKFCKKPQTLLVDFDLDRMLSLQNEKTLIYNKNNELQGNDILEKTLKKELSAFPIMYLNGDKMVKATAANVMEILSNYSKNRSAIDEVYNIPIDDRILSISEIKDFIELENPINSKNGPEFNANISDEESDVDINENDLVKSEESEERDNLNYFNQNSILFNKDELTSLSYKLRTYYLKIMFYSYLTNSRIKNLSEMINSFQNVDNNRIAKNLGIRLSNLKLFKKHIYFSIQNILDNKIHNLNKLANDEEAGKPFERSLTALTSFLVMSPTEHVTPINVAKKMLNYIGKDKLIQSLKNGEKFLDIGCKSGEFVLGLHEVCVSDINISDFKNQIYAVPTSMVAYEFTRKIFHNLNLNLDNISIFTAYELVSLKDPGEKTAAKLINRVLNQNKQFNSINMADEPEGEDSMKFGVIVGNPPYQGNRMQIYPDFYLSSISIAENVCLIFPQGWLEPKDGSRLGLLNNEKVKADKQIVLIDKRENVFPGFAGAKSTNIILWRRNFDNGLNGLQTILTEGINPQITKIPWKKEDVVKPQEIRDLATIVSGRKDFVSVDTITTGRKPFQLENRKNSIFIRENLINKKNDIKIFDLNSVKYVSFDQFNKFSQDAQKLINSYKVFIPYAWGNWSNNYLGGAFADIFIAYPNTMCVEDTFLVAGPFDTYDMAHKHAKYLMTHFARALLLVNKYSQHSTTAWHAIPKQDFHELWWEDNIDKIDKKLFAKYDCVRNNIMKFAFERIQTKDESAIKVKK
jgi:hypothetical protein